MTPLIPRPIIALIAVGLLACIPFLAWLDAYADFDAGRPILLCGVLIGVSFGYDIRARRRIERAEADAQDQGDRDA